MRRTRAPKIDLQTEAERGFFPSFPVGKTASLAGLRQKFGSTGPTGVLARSGVGALSPVAPWQVRGGPKTHRRLGAVPVVMSKGALGVIEEGGKLLNENQKRLSNVSIGRGATRD